MYHITVLKFEPLTAEEKTERGDRDRDRNYRFNEAGPAAQFPNLLDRGEHKVVKVLEVELTEDEFKKVKAGVLEII